MRQQLSVYHLRNIVNVERVRCNGALQPSLLLARIAEKRKYQAEVQKKRQEKLRLRAYSGDYEAARKLKMGKRRMEELFPTLSEKSKQQEENGEDVPVEASREKTPAEPLDYDQEQSQMENGLLQSGLPMLPAGGQTFGHGLSVSPFDINPPKVQTAGDVVPRLGLGLVHQRRHGHEVQALAHGRRYFFNLPFAVQLIASEQRARRHLHVSAYFDFCAFWRRLDVS